MGTFSSTRRSFLHKLLLAGGAFSLEALPLSAFAQSSYAGKFLLTLQLDGGVDVTSFCDPKTNTPGEKEINRWARSQQIRSAGNLRYAPYASNATLFDKYHRHMMVINGIDAQTNSHTVGIIHNWSGRNSEGFPSLTALFAGVKQPELPMAYLNFGGFGATQGIIRSTAVSHIDALRDLVRPNASPWDAQRNYVPPSDVDRVMALHAAQMRRSVADTRTLAGNKLNRELYMDSLSKVDSIAAFADYLPSEDRLQREREVTQTVRSSVHQQIQLALLAFKAGVSVSADLYERGFDTHARHDIDHPLLLSNVTNAIDYLWTYAEELGIAHRLVLVIGTDFGRTPYFNASDGKDHWPIASTIVMEKNAAYGNRMVGLTDEGHNALKINPATLQEDRLNGVIVKPAHVHKALRSYLGLDDSPLTRQFAFANPESFRFFGQA